MKWSYQNYDVTNKPKNETKTQIAKILNDHYSDYNPLCIHTNIMTTYDPSFTQILTVYFPTDQKNLPFSKAPGPNPLGIILAHAPECIEAESLPAILEKIAPESGQIFIPFTWRQNANKDKLLGNIQNWEWRT